MTDLNKLTVEQLRDIARRKKCPGYSTLRRQELIRFVKSCMKKRSPSPKRSPKRSPSLSTSSLTVKQLREVAKKLGCPGYSTLRRVELIKFINRCKNLSPSMRKKRTPKRVSPRQRGVPVLLPGFPNLTYREMPNLQNLKMSELRNIARKAGCQGHSTLRRSELLNFIKKCIQMRMEGSPRVGSSMGIPSSGYRTPSMGTPSVGRSSGSSWTPGPSSSVSSWTPGPSSSGSSWTQGPSSSGSSWTPGPSSSGSSLTSGSSSSGSGVSVIDILSDRKMAEKMLNMFSLEQLKNIASNLGCKEYQKLVDKQKLIENIISCAKNQSATLSSGGSLTSSSGAILTSNSLGGVSLTSSSDSSVGSIQSSNFSKEIELQRKRDRLASLPKSDLFNRAILSAEIEDLEQQLGLNRMRRQKIKPEQLQAVAVELVPSYLQKRPMQEEKCSDILNLNDCVAVLDENNLRRCRVNMKTKNCEFLPHNLRERATLQVGGDAGYAKYVPTVQKLRAEQLQPFKGVKPSIAVGKGITSQVQKLSGQISTDRSSRDLERQIMLLGDTIQRKEFELSKLSPNDLENTNRLQSEIRGIEEQIDQLNKPLQQRAEIAREKLRSTGKKVLQQVKVRNALLTKSCSNITDKDECLETLDRNGLRKCRLTDNDECELIPVGDRQSLEDERKNRRAKIQAAKEARKSKEVLERMRMEAEAVKQYEQKRLAVREGLRKFAKGKKMAKQLKEGALAERKAEEDAKEQMAKQLKEGALAERKAEEVEEAGIIPAQHLQLTRPEMGSYQQQPQSEDESDFMSAQESEDMSAQESEDESGFMSAQEEDPEAKSGTRELRQKGQEVKQRLKKVAEEKRKELGGIRQFRQKAEEVAIRQRKIAEAEEKRRKEVQLHIDRLDELENLHQQNLLPNLNFKEINKLKSELYKVGDSGLKGVQRRVNKFYNSEKAKADYEKQEIERRRQRERESGFENLEFGEDIMGYNPLSVQGKEKFRRHKRKVNSPNRKLSKRKLSKRKTPKRKLSKRKSPKRKSPKRKSPKRKSPKRKTPKRKLSKRKSPARRR